MTEEQFKELMKMLDTIALQITKVAVGIGITMTGTERNAYTAAVKNLETEWNKQ